MSPSAEFYIDNGGFSRHPYYPPPLRFRFEQDVAGKFAGGTEDSVAGRRVRSMNRAALIEFVHKGMGKDASRVAADRAVSLVIEGIKAGLQKDKSVQLIGFGTFKVVERKARVGINPKTRQPLKIEQSRTVKLAIGKDLKSGL